MRVVDTHLHLWDPWELEYHWLEGAMHARFAEAEIFEEQLPGVSEEVSIFVQAGTVDSAYIDEVAWVEGIADAAGVVAIVAGALLDRGDATAAHLDRLAAHERVVGVRHLLQSEPDGTASASEFIAGARLVAERGWTFDACVVARQLSDVTALAAAVPDLFIVLDHLGKPQIGSAEAPLRPSAEWLRDLYALAAHPRVRCKLSGLPAETGGVWTDAQVNPFLDAALDAFGPERLLWGSDWPVSSVETGAPAERGYLVGARARWFRTVADWAHARGVDADALFWSNALEFYGIR
ncbi:amidohydrolase [Streptomyces sp. AC495_CC817]|uniref:amidohydrolase family protein n=1 Tax=Streptomyces sp. AC495_CC817 TaxID=2823900 RepID=UPI001C256EED|nr:amidohydrolase family protein [Streptomyces sp. AC495_CC817]